MHIVELRSENVKRIKAITIRPDGNMVIIGGDNEQGKTSALDSIEYVLGGKGAICDEPVRRGAEKAKIVADLGDLIVTRTITKAGGGLLTVANKEDGAKYDSPQKLLDGFVGKIAFDPLEFSDKGKTADGRAWQLETLKGLVGLDFAQIDIDRAKVYKERTTVNTLGKSIKAQFDAAVHYPDAPEEAVSITELLKTLESRKAVNKTHEGYRNALERANKLLAEAEKNSTRLEREAKEARELLATRDSAMKQQKTLCDKLKDEDESEITKQISTAEETNLQVTANTNRTDLSKQLEAKKKKSQELTDKINTFDADKTKQLAGAKFPIDGLSFDDTGVTYKGLPFCQASGAQSLRVSVSIGIAMNPKLKVILIRNGSLLDTNNRKLLHDMAQESGHQIWMEVVGKEAKDCTVIIEDGQIVGVEDGQGVNIMVEKEKVEEIPVTDQDFLDDI